jgi:hypothetical protein
MLANIGNVSTCYTERSNAWRERKEGVMAMLADRGVGGVASFDDYKKCGFLFFSGSKSRTPACIMRVHEGCQISKNNAG